MKAAVLYGPNDIKVEDTNLFSLRPKQVLGKVIACGLCHTDYTYFSGNVPIQYPRILGHEILFTIEDMGSEISERYTIGTTALALPLYGCENCPDCNAGDQNICSSSRFMGNTDDGGFAEYVVLPWNNVFPIRNADESNCVVPDAYATAYNAIKMSKVSKGDKVAVFGAGGVGGALIDILASAYDAKVFVVDVKDSALQLAKDMGAAECLNLKDYLNPDGSVKTEIYKVLKKSTNDSIRNAFDCVGKAETQLNAMKTVRRGGFVGAIGFSVDKALNKAGDYMAKQMTVGGPWGCPPRYMLEVIKLAEDGTIHPKKLVTAKYSLNTITKAFEDLHSGKITGRAIITPQEIEAP